MEKRRKLLMELIEIAKGKWKAGRIPQDFLNYETNETLENIPVMFHSKFSTCLHVFGSKILRAFKMIENKNKIPRYFLL